MDGQLHCPPCGLEKRIVSLPQAAFGHAKFAGSLASGRSFLDHLEHKSTVE